MPTLTEAEVTALLAGPVIARLATVTPDGAPYVAPLWQHWVGAAMFFVVRERAAFVAHLRAEPRVAVSCADDVDPQHPRVLIEGRAHFDGGPAPMSGPVLEIAREMAGRYGGEDGLRYLEGTLERPRYLVRVVPEKMTTWRGAWHPRYR